MKPDLEKIQITESELRLITGLDPYAVINPKQKIKRENNNDNQGCMGIIILIVIGLILLPITLGIGTIICWWIAFSMNARSKEKNDQEKSRIAQIKEQDKKNNDLLKKLVQEVDNFNTIIRNIDVVDQLEAAGNPVSVSDREQILTALGITRTDLERALKTERILRENPEFNSQNFSINLMAFNAIKVSDQASEYGKICEQALKVSMSVQEEMKQLQKTI